jgi:putative membrane protein
MWIHHQHHVGGFGGWGFGFFVIGVLILLVLTGMLLLAFRGAGLHHARRAPTTWSGGDGSPTGGGPGAGGAPTGTPTGGPAGGPTGGPGGAPPGGPGGSWGPPGRTVEAERILGERFARGEIDEEEYQQRLRVLREHGAGPGGGS